MSYTAPVVATKRFEVKAVSPKASKAFATALLSSVCAFAAVGLVAGSVSAQYGDGFKPFAQDSCDPLLSGVLTEDGYQPTDLDELYQRAYNEDVGRGCGFAKVGDVSTETPFPNPPAQQFPTPPVQQFPDVPTFNPNPQPAPVDNVVIPEPFDLPDLDLSDDDTGSGIHTGLYARLFGAYAKTSGSAGTNTRTPDTYTFTDTVDAGYGGSATLGYAFNFDGLGFFNNLRSEVQGSYYQFDGGAFTTATITPTAPNTVTDITYTQGKETLMGGFVNLVSDIEFGLLPVTPYIGAGLGYGRRDIDFGSDTFKEDGLLYQAMIGGRYSITERLSLDLGYKYLKSFDIKTAIGTNGTYTLDGRDHHIVEGGVTFKF